METLTIDIKKEQEKAQELIKKQGRRILVCASTGCLANGALELIEKFKELGCNADVLTNEVKMSVIPTGCIGFCEQGCLVVIPDKKLTYVHVKKDDVEEIYNSLLNNTVVERLLYVDPALNKKIVNNEEMNFYAKQTRTAMKNCGIINPESLDEAIANGAYAALAKVLEKNDQEYVLKEIEDSGLRGRGGGGFATGRKWRSVNKNQGGKSYVICNGDEGDPGAFMDRSVMEDDPNKLLEGMAIAAFAVGADEGYIYVRAEYPLAIKRLKLAIKAAEERLKAAGLPVTDENLFIAAACKDGNVDKGIDFLLGKGTVSVNKVSADAKQASDNSDTNGYTVTVNGKKYAVALEGAKAVVNGKLYDFNVKAGIEAKASSAEGTPVKAALPGNVLKVLVSEGDTISEGDVIAVVEAMKMETEIKSPVSGTVKSVEIEVGNKVQNGQVLVTIG